MSAVNFGGGFLIGSYQDGWTPTANRKQELTTKSWEKLDTLRRQNIEAEPVVFVEDQWDLNGYYYLVATKKDAVELKELNQQEQKVMSMLRSSKGRSDNHILIKEVKKAFYNARNKIAYQIYKKALKGETDV